MTKNILTLAIGVILFALIIVYSVNLGGRIEMFIDIPSAVIVIFGGVGIALMFSAKDLTPRNFFRNLQPGSIAAGFIGTLTGTIILQNAMWEDAQNLIVAISVALIPLLYAAIVFTVARCAEKWLENPKKAE